MRFLRLEKLKHIAFFFFCICVKIGFKEIDNNKKNKKKIAIPSGNRYIKFVEMNIVT